MPDPVADAAAAAAAAAAANSAVWHTGVEPEMLGFWQNKGYKTDDPKVLASELTKQYRQLESHLGAPPDQLLRMPKADAKPEELRAFRERLGAPKEAKDYDLSAVKDETIAESLRAAAHATGLPKDAAASMAAAVAKALESKTASDKVAADATYAEQKATLSKNWGTKFDLNMLTASQGAKRLGFELGPNGNPEDNAAVAAMEKAYGYARVMELFRNIGANTREADFVQGGPGGAGGPPTTLEGAKSRLEQLMGDPAWNKRFTSGDAEAKKQWRDLLDMMHPGERNAA